MEKTLESVEALLGRKLKGEEKTIYLICKDDDKYEFRVGKNGFLEGHLKKASAE